MSEGFVCRDQVVGPHGTLTLVSEFPSFWTDPPPAWDVTAEYPVAAVGARKEVDWHSIWSMLSTTAAARYTKSFSAAELVEFEHGPASYLFDHAGRPQAERTVLAAARTERPSGARDSAYQAGYPLPELVGGRQVDRGHFVPYSGGGLFGPNLFIEDRALNRGWSRQGRLYRALETRAVAADDGTLFVRPSYHDVSDVPALLDLGVIDDRGCVVYRFRNRYDPPLGRGEDQLEVVLNGAVNAQIGALGEETAAAFLVEAHNAIIVAMGDAGMPRDGSAQDLDLLAILDGVLVAFEVKTRFIAKAAGRRTRAGNLARPRMRRPSAPTASRQGSQEYVAARLARFADIDADYSGVEVRVIAVDFRLMEIQQFALNDSGTRLSPLGVPADCTDAARAALALIQEHRGHL